MRDGRGTTITCAGGLPAYLTVPDSDGPHPCLVLMHERYGLVRHIQELADRFARDGFVCIAPDFYFKHPDQAALHRGESAHDMTDPEAVDYLSAAVAALNSVPQADLARLAIKGVCQTGRHPLVYAAEHKVAAALVWYGGAQPREWKVNRKYPRPLEEIIARVNCPVLGMFGEADNLISIDDVRRFRDCLERAHKTYEIHLYRDAPHGWLNDTMPGRYRRAQAEAAWAAQLAFLREVLAPDYDRSRVRQRYEADVSTSYDFSKNVRYE
ncbi:MAG TPA: dienelactone hydrolase family protein [Alphaproteobacteria bacterium]